MPHYLVTGGLGFIGGHLVHALLEDAEAHVTVVDNLINSVFSAGDLIEQISVGKPGRLEVHVQCLKDFGPQRSFERVYHLASIVGPAAVLHHSGSITESIVRDTYLAIRFAQAQRAQLINISTSEVYGGGDRGFCQEETPRVIKGPTSARQEYAAAKMACEVSIANLCATKQLSAVTIRPFNVSGVRQLGQGGFVLPRFVGQAILGHPLTVFGDGLQIRAFTDARDVASGILMAGQKGASGAFYNVGNPANRTTIRELAALVIQVAQSTSRIEFADPKAIYGRHYEEAADKFPDASRLMDLGWQPQWALVQTIEAVFSWFQTMPRDLMLRAAGLAQT